MDGLTNRSNNHFNPKQKCYKKMVLKKFQMCNGKDIQMRKFYTTATNNNKKAPTSALTASLIIAKRIQAVVWFLRVSKYLICVRKSLLLAVRWKENGHEKKRESSFLSASKKGTIKRA